ncbi:hypothetical protein EDB92DRAFT_506460 [Lactarius akahatsu]|uniref:Uncharacterized protein n=1 Tax=Lactarius akahatsu TaxID=416441 RepID=A0AAD4LV05_9AGAM|nr:hypothetical protein EDB92DRAFT_506460 [Lactarius akahatsu]
MGVDNMPEQKVGNETGAHGEASVGMRKGSDGKVRWSSVKGPPTCGICEEVVPDCVTRRRTQFFTLRELDTMYKNSPLLMRHRKQGIERWDERRCIECAAGQENTRTGRPATTEDNKPSFARPETISCVDQVGCVARTSRVVSLASRFASGRHTWLRSPHFQTHNWRRIALLRVFARLFSLFLVVVVLML